MSTSICPLSRTCVVGTCTGIVLVCVTDHTQKQRINPILPKCAVPEYALNCATPSNIALITKQAAILRYSNNFALVIKF